MIHSCDDSQIMQALRKANAPESAFRTVYKDGIDIDRPAHWVIELIEILTAKPAQAVPVGYISEEDVYYFEQCGTVKISKRPDSIKTVPVFAEVPPAIDDETQIREKLEAGNGSIKREM